jgi:phosphoserine aminotransferase
LEGEPDLIDGVKAEAKAQGILLGAGYGKWKSSTFRVANFPAYTEAQIEQLFQFIRLLG